MTDVIDKFRDDKTTSDEVDHNLTINTHNLTTDSLHNTITNTHNLTTDIDHNTITNTHNLTTDIDHDTITNTHNLTTDIDHDLLTNYVLNKHIDWTNATQNIITTGNITAEKYSDNGWKDYTITGNGDTIEHDNYSVVYAHGSVLNMVSTWTIDIANGTYDGQRLTLLLKSEATSDFFMFTGQLHIKLNDVKRAVKTNLAFVNTITATERFDIVWNGSSWRTTDGLSENDWTGGMGSWASGTSTASGESSHAEGSSVSSGINSHAEGHITTASGTYSHAEGDYSISSGTRSHTQGYRNESAGQGSFTAGRYMKTTGSYSTLFGYKSSLQTFTDNYFFTLYGLDSWLASDTKKFYLGLGKDANMMYDGSHLWINSDNVGTGSLKIGDATNHLEIKPDGEISLNGTAKVQKCVWIGANGIKAPSSKPATFIEYGLTGVWQFADAITLNQESISGTLKIPCDMDITTAPSFNIGWSATGSSVGDCEWQLEYLWIAPNEATNGTAQETLTTISTSSSTSNGFVFATITGINLPSSTDMALLWKLTRLSGGGNDTISDNVELRGNAFNYTSNKLGVTT